MTGVTLDAQLRNWDNFCQYHALGDWHGIWTRYSPTGEVVESFQCIRSLRASADGREVTHQNHYTYADGTSETKSFGPYYKPATRSLFLDNSFSWGSTKLEFGSPFGFETGFTVESRRVSVGVLYDRNARLEKITIIAEHLASVATETNPCLGDTEKLNYKGTDRAIAPNLAALPETSAVWCEIEDLGEDYLTIHQAQDGISVSCPRQIESRDFVLAVDWQVNSTLLQRGIRHFNSSEFTHFSLEVFTLA